jgi:hypothetical protein
MVTGKMNEQSFLIYMYYYNFAEKKEKKRKEEKRKEKKKKKKTLHKHQTTNIHCICLSQLGIFLLKGGWVKND